jgi:hypothetical protein
VRRNTFWSHGKCAFCSPDGFAERGPCASFASRLLLPGRPARFVGASLNKRPDVSTAGGGILPCSSRASALRLFPRPTARHPTPIPFLPSYRQPAIQLCRATA